MNYSNFKDPLGLLGRILRSKDKTAYFVLFREALTIILTPLDLLLQLFEKNTLKNATENSLPIILILGGSRNGTTLLYQTIVQYLPVSYFSNLIASFPRAPITAYRLFGKLFQRPKRNFKSYYGSVTGLAGPSDAFSIWNRWLGKDRNNAPNQIGKQQQAEMKHFFHAWHRIVNMPLVNKNNRNSLCVPLLDTMFKNIFFIEIHRNPVYVAQSLVLSRMAIQGNKTTGWGLLSKDSESATDKYAYIDDVCHQVYEVDKVLEQARNNVDSTKYIRVNYENFCRDPKRVVQDISQKVLGQTCASKDLESLIFDIDSNQQRLADEEFGRILRGIENLYGKFSSTNNMIADDL